METHEQKQQAFKLTEGFIVQLSNKITPRHKQTIKRPSKQT